MQVSETGSRSKLPLLALAVGAFGIGTTEFSPMGLLPVIADGVHVSIPSAGLLVSAYAIGVMLGAPVMTLAFNRFSKRTALLLLMTIFTIGNILSAIAPGYTTLMLARVITSLNHGAFFGIGAVVAASLVPREKQASAVAAMFMGLTIANIGGVPAATWVGQQIGWRMAFGATALLGLVTMASLYLTIGKGEPGRRPDVRRELGVLTRPAVLFAMSVTVMAAGSLFAVYTYVVPALAALTPNSASFATLFLMLIGVGFTLGNWIGGRLADWSPIGATVIFLLALAAIALSMPVTLGNLTSAAITLTVWGVAAFALVPPVQTMVMQEAADAPGMASSVNIGAFNLGNALGAAAGGAVLSLGFGYQAVPVIAGALALGGLALLWAGQRHASVVAVKA